MGANDLILAAALGAVCLAISATLWTLVQRRRGETRVSGLSRRLMQGEHEAAAAFAALETDHIALLCVERGRYSLVAGEAVFRDCAKAFEVEAAPMAVMDALMRADPAHARRLGQLLNSGAPCRFTAWAGDRAVTVDGGPAGGLVWLRLAFDSQAAPVAADDRLTEFVNAEADPAWVARADGRLVWANRAWLAAVDAASVEDALERNLGFDKAADALVVEAAQAGAPRETVRWTTLRGQRRALRIVASPLDGGDVGVRATDVTEAEGLREAVRRHARAHDETLNHIADAVAIFGADKHLAFHNTAFANLWGLEPAWLAEAPTHGELLDRLRQRRRLPETADYAAWKAGELAHYETVDQGPDDLWTLPDGRTLRVVRQTHPLGGLLLLFSDMTGELRMKAQYNALIQVQQATLDKLNDAVAVFASDGRLRLHNEAFERFWNVSSTQLDDAGDFDGVAQLCVPRLHDMAFWRELKGRVTDPDPHARVPTGGEARTGDDRIVAWQSRPLPDGATLIGFDDVTDTRRLEKAVTDRSAALAEAERLKRDFVGNVSYELRTPLTTIIGYSELLDHTGDALPERARAHVASVRAAATQLARSIDDVLDMAQIDAGEMALDLGDVSVCELLDQTRDRFAREAAGAEVAVEIDCPDTVALIRADNRKLGQILDHLMENALRQSPRGGTVTLKAQRAASEVTIQVTDQGRGIPFHVQAHIFDRFVGRERGGPGLGLALVKALVELHGGWVALESEPGAGATFTLHLPEAAYVSEGELF
jgi:signal transduction histidine kinase